MRRLTDASFWEEGWWQRKRPERLWLYRDLDFEMVRLLARAGGSTGARQTGSSGFSARILEAGCDPPVRLTNGIFSFATKAFAAAAE